MYVVTRTEDAMTERAGIYKLPFTRQMERGIREGDGLSTSGISRGYKLEVDSQNDEMCISAT
jgi:hypothetical protein